MHLAVMDGSISNILHLQRSELSDILFLHIDLHYENLTTIGFLGIGLTPE